MPLVHIDLIAGRDPRKIADCAKRIAAVVHETLGAPLHTIRVITQEVPATHWLIGDRTRAEIDADAQAAKNAAA